MWEQKGYLFAVLLLAYHSVFDVRAGRIPGRSLAAGAIVSGFWAMGEVLLTDQLWTAFILGLIPGTAVLLLAKATRGQVGCGDGWEIMIMGNLLGWVDCLLGLGIALLGIFLISAVLLLLRKVKGNSRIPFVPFLCMGTMIVTVFRLAGASI